MFKQNSEYAIILSLAAIISLSLAAISYVLSCNTMMKTKSFADIVINNFLPGELLQNTAEQSMKGLNSLVQNVTNNLLRRDML